MTAKITVSPLSDAEIITLRLLLRENAIRRQRAREDEERELRLEEELSRIETDDTRDW